MDRSSDPPSLTTTEVAELLGVHGSTVKRWCNEGALEFATTNGGHRRFAVGAAARFARERGIPTVLTSFHPYEPHVWSALRDVRERGSFHRLHSLAMGWVHRGRMRRLGRLFDALARTPGVGLCTLCDEGIRDLMKLVGDAWQAGKLRVGEEHMVTQVMVEALLRLRAEQLEDRPEEFWEAAPVAVVGTLEGNQHHLGSMCVRMLMEFLGFEVHYLGPDVPVEDFAVVQRSREADVVCISLSPPASAGDVARTVDTLSRFYDPARPYALALGGEVDGGVEPELLQGPFERVAIFSGCRPFGAAIRSGFVRRPEGVVP
jgi:excisionase family DNA binding protein